MFVSMCLLYVISIILYLFIIRCLVIKDFLEIENFKIVTGFLIMAFVPGFNLIVTISIMILYYVDNIQISPIDLMKKILFIKNKK